jgi:hypothetical protein
MSRHSRRFLCHAFAAVLPGLLAAAPQPSEDEVRGTLHEVLSRPEFSTTPRRPAWVEWILHRLADFFSWLASLRMTSPVLFWLLLLGTLLLLALLLGYILWSVRRVLYRQGRSAHEETAEERRRRMSQVCEEEARQRAAMADFTEAIRYLFLALIYRFDEKGRVSFQQACTNREYLGLFADRPRIHDRLRVFVDTLDDYWYGQRPTDSRQYEDCLNHYQELIRVG